MPPERTKSEEGQVKEFKMMEKEFFITPEQLRRRIKALDKTNRRLQKAFRELRNRQINLVQSEKISSLGQLASEVAHEVNNPLTSIIGHVQILLQDKSLNEKTKQGLEVILGQADRIAQHIKNLSHFANPSQATKLYLNLNELVENVLILKGPTLRMQNIKVVKQLAQQPPRAMMDYQQMHQVLLLLIKDAEQAMAQEGRGTLTVKTESVPKKIRISISNTGQGMPGYPVKGIFDPFLTSYEDGRGTGFRLSVCYRIIKQHRGTLYMEAQPGQGTTVIIELPITKKAP